MDNDKGILHLGNCYLTGVGTPMDKPRAFGWYTVAAEKGIVAAMFCLAECYMRGLGCEVDAEKGREWHRRVEESNQEGFGVADLQAALQSRETMLF
jgi:TPR repeat protein